MTTRISNNRVSTIMGLILGVTVSFAIAEPVQNAPLPRSQQSKVDVTGKWMLEVKTQAGGTTTPSVTLKQDGEKLSGHYSSATLGEAEVTGTVKGQQIDFYFNAEVQGFALQVRYTGTVKGDAMEGKISLGELGDGTFTGKKQ